MYVARDPSELYYGMLISVVSSPFYDLLHIFLHIFHEFNIHDICSSVVSSLFTVHSVTSPLSSFAVMSAMYTAQFSNIPIMNCAFQQYLQCALCISVTFPLYALCISVMSSMCTVQFSNIPLCISVISSIRTVQFSKVKQLHRL